MNGFFTKYNSETVEEFYSVEKESYTNHFIHLLQMFIFPKLISSYAFVMGIKEENRATSCIKCAIASEIQGDISTFFIKYDFVCTYPWSICIKDA